MVKGKMVRRYFLHDGGHGAALRSPSRQGDGGWRKWLGCRSSATWAGGVAARDALAFMGSRGTWRHMWTVGAWQLNDAARSEQ
jgi:hypothetical protein